MKRVVSIALMRESEAYTIETLASASELMRRAGEEIFKRLPQADSYAIICGEGNNGGDGYVTALYLKRNGRSVSVFSVGDKISELSRYFCGQCVGEGVEIKPFDSICSDELNCYSVIVDCIFGIGFNKAPKGIYANAINAINNSRAYVVSADINSGLDAESGICFYNGSSPLCVKSDLTVAIGEYKPGHFLSDAKDVIKSLDCADIGIKLLKEPYYLCEAVDFKAVFPKRKHNSHKGTYGTAAVFGGCLQYSGAVKLANASLSQLKCGCGISRLIVPEQIAAAVAPYLLESTLYTVPSDFNIEATDGALKGVASLAVGMGWGRNTENQKTLSYIIEHFKRPLVIDADGLFALAALNKRELSDNIVLTPHPAEFSRLCGIQLGEILKNPITTAREYANSHGAILLLKGACTVVTDGERVFLIDRGAPGMATAGSGDVLSGIIAGINAQNPTDLLLNAAAGTWIAGVAGEFAQAEKTAVSMTASDTVANIYKAIAQILAD